MPLPANFHSELIRWRSFWMRQKNWLTLSNNHIEATCWHHIFPKNVWTFQDNLCHSCRKRRSRGAYLWKTDACAIGSVVVAMSRDQLKESAVIAMRSHAILNLKTDIYKAYTSISPHRMTISSLFNDAWFVRYFYIS